MTPNLVLSSNFLHFYMINDFETYAATVISKGNYHYVRDRLKTKVHTFPILMDQVPIRHTIAVIRNKRKYLPSYGTYFLSLAKDAFMKIGE